MISTNDSPSAGDEWPALQRLRAARMLSISSGIILPRPTSNSVPTIARTILRRKRSAVMTNVASVSFSCVQYASFTLQIVVLASVCARQKEAKSCLPNRYSAASFIASKSRPSATRVWLKQRNGSLRIVIRYRYVRASASKRAWATSITCRISRTAMEAGSKLFSRPAKLAGKG